MESLEEVSEAFKELKKGIIARADSESISRLRLFGCEIDSISG